MTRGTTEEHTPELPTADMPGIARGGLLNLAGAGISAATGVLLTVVVTRALSKDDAGIFFTLTSLFLLAETLACLGTGTGLVYFTARLRSLGRPELVRGFQRVGMLPVLMLSLAVAAGMALAASALAGVVGDSSADVRTAVLVMAVLLPVAALSDTVLAATRGHAAMRPTVVLDKVGRPLVQLALVAMALVSGSVAVVAGAWVLPWLVTAVLAGRWLSRLQRQLPASAQSSRRTWREFWLFTWPRAVNSLAQIALQRLDIVLITVLIGPAEAAVYTAATRFLVVGQLSSTAVSSAAQPRLAGLLAVDDRASAGAVYRSATAWIVLLTWPVYLLCAVFADAVLSLFGAGYDAGRTVVLVLAGAMLVATACGMVDMLLNMAGRTTMTLVNSVVAVAVMVGLDLVLIPSLGILGAAIGWGAAILVNNLLPLAQLMYLLRLHPFGRSTLTAAALAATCFGLLPAATRLLTGGDTTASLTAIALGVAVYAAACLRWHARLGLPTLSSLRPRASRPSPAGIPDRVTTGGRP
ncbi:hypothetical protein GCM10010531_26800 [Blastococcus jejuensis]|uniref:Membrane protein involved in the export of O-antigen and teichoic acid n=1 Tax=Blastococcus jejuensis TaxID=351224 RepID=A0ABP6P9N1_9ACTN